MELTPMTEVGGLPLDVTATPDAHAMNTGTDLDSVSLDLDPVTTAIGVVAVMTLIEVAPDHSTDLPIATSHMIETPVPTAAIMTHPTTHLHLTGTLPVTTADLDIGPGNIITIRQRFFIHFTDTILETQGQKTQTSNNQ